MSRRIIVLVSTCIYLAVLGCVLVPGSASDNQDLFRSPADRKGFAVNGEPYRGCAIQITRVDWMDKYKQCVDKVVEVGGNTVEFVVSARQEDGNSSHIYLDMRMTPTSDQLGDLIKYAKDKKLRVVLMPIVLLDDPGTKWRGNITPDDWSKWFTSYREMIKSFAYTAESYHADVLCVGSELVSSEEHVKEWSQTIDAVRDIFKGKLTYSANWDHYNSVAFWNQLDLFSINCYYKLGSDRNASEQEIEETWRPIQAKIVEFSRKIDRPLMFSEVGWCSIANAAYEPWDYTKPESEVPTDFDLQKRLYKGFFHTWHGNPDLGGFMVWEIVPDGGPGDTSQQRGYTPEGKPAEKVLRQYLAKPWNEPD